MHILLTNDDGFEADGIRALYKALKTVADVTIVAPNKNKSAVSHGITLFKDIKVEKIKDGIYCVDGTPADCVKMVKAGLICDRVDLVISGINHGPNLGYDVLYSGTVGAAREGQFSGIPSIAVSVLNPKNPKFDNASRFIVGLVKRLGHMELPKDILFNVNVPDSEKIEGVEITRLSRKHYHEEFIPQGNGIFKSRYGEWKNDYEKDTDISATFSNRISVTPLLLDTTCMETLARSEELKRLFS